MWRTLLGLMALLAVLCAPAPAQTAAELVKDANKLLRDGQRKMFSGKNDEAIQQLIQAAKIIKKIEAEDADNRSLRSLKSKTEKLRKDLQRKTGKQIDLEAGTVSAGGATKKQPKGTAKPAAGSKKLPSGVTHRLKKIDQPLQRAERKISDDAAVVSAESRVKQANHYLQKAKDIMAEIQKRYGDQIPAGNAEVKAAEEKIARVEKLLAEFSAGVSRGKAAAAEKDAVRKADAEKWLARLNPFILAPHQAGHVEGKYLIPAGTANVEELKKRKAIYDEAKKVFGEYEAAVLKAGKTYELERAEKELRRALASFEEGYAASQGNMLELATKRVDEALAFLQNKQEWRKDQTQKPYVLASDRIQGIEKLIAKAAEAAADNPELPALRKKMAQLTSANAERRKVRTARTFMTADRYAGTDLGEIKKVSELAVTRKFKGATLLRTTVISETWKEERVLEHTDTTRTKVRYRVTRRLVSQVAGKTKDGTFLYTVNVEKDRQSDNSWGALKSHVMFIDAMLEQNVHQPGPAKK
ncbi:MAG: hypothetical protein ACYTKC_08270 [Planctomycetota bacterium]